MKTVRKNSKDALSRRDPVRDGLIVLCMTVVALALGIGLHLQFALAFWLAVVAALAVYVALLSTHILVRRSEDIERLRRELSRLEGTVAGALVGTEAMTSGAATRASDAAPILRGTTVAGVEAGREGGAHFGDYWKFSPAEPDAGSPAVTAAAVLAVNAGGEPARTAPEPRPTIQNVQPTNQSASNNRQRDADAAQIDAVIKKLAADITQGQAAMAEARQITGMRSLSSGLRRRALHPPRIPSAPESHRIC